MPVMLDQPTNEKLDALGVKVDDLRAQMERGFARIDTELREQRQGMKAGFAHIDERFERVDERFERFDERFERVYRLLIQFCGATIVALIGLIATQV